MTKTRILWINDNRDSHTYVVGRLLEEYDTEIYMPDNNADALRLAQDGWDIAFYDMGMDEGNGIHNMPVASRLRELLGDAVFVGVSMDTSAYTDFTEYFDEIEDSVHFLSPYRFVDFAKKHGIVIEKRDKVIARRT